MNILLAVDGPLDAGATLARYHLWGEDPANRLAGPRFLRALRVDGRIWPYAVRWTGHVDDVRLAVHLPGTRSTRVGEAVVSEVRKVFGLDFDVPGFYRATKADAALGPLVERLHGLRPTLTPVGLEMLVGSITAQQVNLAFAFTLRARLVRRYGTPARIGGETVYAFPEAAVLARATLSELRRMQFSVRKAEYIRDLAAGAAAGEVDLPGMADAANDAIIERLTSRRGLGRWTADWYMARCLGRGDVCPAGDLAVRKAFDHFYGRGRRLGEETIRRRARAWGAHQTMAVHYLLAGMRLARPAVGGGT